jgi:hypothetical protein
MVGGEGDLVRSTIAMLSLFAPMMVAICGTLIVMLIILIEVLK